MPMLYLDTHIDIDTLHAIKPKMECMHFDINSPEMHLLTRCVLRASNMCGIIEILSKHIGHIHNIRRIRKSTQFKRQFN